MIKLTKRFALLFISLLASSSIFFSCTDVDKTLGLEFIPDDEKLEFRIDTIYPHAFTVKSDSLYSHSPGRLMIGSHYDPMFGQTVSGAAFQFLARTDTVDFGPNATYQSLMLKMALIDKPIGDNTSDQFLRIYELKDRIYYDSVYHACVPIKTMIEPTPIATAIYKGEDTLTIDLGPAYASKLLGASKEIMTFNRDTLSNSPFFDYVKGLYIVADNSNGTSRMNFFNPYASLTLRYNGPSGLDTCEYSTHYSYDYSGNQFFFAQFNAVEHDYTSASSTEGIQYAKLNDTTATGLDSVLYLQGLFGAVPYVNIKSETLKSWLQNINLEASQVAIIRAELIMELEEFPDFDITKYPGALGGMTLLNPLVSYNYYYGTMYVAGCLMSFYYSLASFDGTLNTGFKKYSFNITHELADQLKKQNDLKFYLAPYTNVSSSGSAQYNTLLYSLSNNQYNSYRAVMRGPTHSNPLKLVITYAIPQ